MANCETRYAYNPEDFKTYGTDRIRKEFLVETVFVENEVSMVYSHIERYIVAGAFPKDKAVSLEPVDQLKAEYFLERRELGAINIGGPGRIVTEDASYELGYKDALYLGRGTKKVVFESLDYSNPAKFYINSANAHKALPAKLVKKGDANVLQMGSQETSNERAINQLLIKEVVETCQLQMGMTELKPGSVWNTMPAHTHDRRNEVYFYFEVPEGQAVCHFMGQPQETRHIFMGNEQAVISPAWSIHSAAGTSNYTFIWGMAGENLDYTDMDFAQPNELR